MFVELNARRDADHTVSLEWDPDTGTTQIVIAEIGTACMVAFPVGSAKAAHAFRHPFWHLP